MPISAWSTTAASNNAAPPNGWPEGMLPSAVNDTARQQMADHRTQWQDAEWFNWGDTVSRNANAVFKIAADVTTRYLAHRRIKCFDTSTIYGTVVSSTYSAPDTTITITTDSGNLSSSLSSVALATLTPTSVSVPSTIGRKGADIASATTTDIGAATAGFVDVTGTTTITGLGTIAAGVVRKVRFTGALTLTHHATSLILPGAANITTAANDRAEFVSLGSGNWLCFNYVKASGLSIINSTAPFADNVAIIKDSDDTTKLLRIEAGAIATGTERILSMPDNDVNLTNGAFYAYASSATAVANNAATKITLATELFDVNSWFDSTTNYRYTPQVAGKYLICGSVDFNTLNAAGQIIGAIYKNGSEYAKGVQRLPAANLEGVACVAIVVDMNGSTDYVELYAYQDGGGTENTQAFSSVTYLAGYHIPS